MTELKELRIGNIVWESSSFTPGPDDFEEIVVGAINDIDKIVIDTKNNIYSYDYLYPIPLTSEWLARCGFKTDGNGDDNHPHPLWKHPQTRYQFSDGSFVHNGAAYDDWHDIGDVQFVHQLQNLYFALTGEELPIKE